MFVSNDFVFKFIITFDLLFDSKTWLYAGELVAIVFFVYVLCWYKNMGKNPKKIIKTTENDKEIDAGLEQAHFQTEEELMNNYKTYNYKALPKIEVDGVPIKALEKDNDYKITFTNSAHSMIIGTTGSGKTTTFINPTIQILSQTKNKPSMIVSDPKGELFALHSKSLKSKGYDIKVIDLRNPYCSIRWNPLERPFLMYQEMLHLEDKKIVDETSGKLVFEDKEYESQEDLSAAIQARKQEIFDEIYEDLNDICSVLAPVVNKSDPIWESGAKNFILAICLAMLEDSENPNLGITKEKYNFYNILKIATNTQNDCADLISYFSGRSPVSKAVNLSKQVLDASDKTRGSYLSTVFDKLALFSDMSICSLTSANEIDFGEIVEKPTVLFLQIPDEKETRHTIASMVVLQAYKALVSKANIYENLALPRSVYFLLDEFGNLPRIHKLEQMITVGRSRKIWFALVVQSYAQLAKVYDEKSADIIKSNCNIQIFIGTTDQRTIEEFSKKCGNFSIIQRNVSYSSGNDNVGSSISVRERPLIYPTELQQLNCPNNMGNAIVNIFGYPPILSKFTPSYNCSCFDLKKDKQELLSARFFDEMNVLYNILDRNKQILSKRSENESIENKEKERLLESLKMQVEKLDYEEIGCGEIKIDLLMAIDATDFDSIVNLLSQMERMAESLESDNLIEIKLIKKKVEHIKRL